ncbi:MAG: tRNA 2-selenouridine(34) synthase MnmH [Campylobacteraceae bacterium]|nr:tRNA 2-selenouridine(34) synthase MnmH [Campylobacteraceae bacterium]
MLSSEFKSIVLNSTPLIDVRAPIEFEKGSLPYSINLPIINNQEREEIGVCYKKYGNKEALKLGHELVCGAIKKERIKAWVDFVNTNQGAKLFCFRGGQRSRISQEWLNQSGYEVSRLKGGYKAFRNYLLNEIEISCTRFKPIILGGHTGSGKTILLKTLENSIDFEGLANHRGSSFGKKTTPQPTQINFENSLAYELIQKLDKGHKSLVFEDEGNHIGGLYVPKTLTNYLLEAPLIILQRPINERVEITFDEYVVEAQKRYENKLEHWRDEMLSAMHRIERRLGSKRHKEICNRFEDAFTEQARGGSLEAHKEWIKILLSKYYDPMYDYQIQRRTKQIEFGGSSEEILEYLLKKLDNI